MAEKPHLTGPEIEACLQEIAGARERLGRVLMQARDQGIPNPLDWRAWVRDHPVGCLLGAAAAGFILSGPAGSSGGEGRSTLLEEITRTGLERVVELLLKTQI